MGLITPSRLTRQPTQPVQIDWANPITRGLVLVQVGANAPAFTASNAPGSKATRYGIAKTFSRGATQYLSADAKGASTSSLTFLAITSIATAGTDQAIISYGNAGVDRAVLYITADTRFAFFVAGSNGSDQAGAASMPVVSGFNTLIGRANGPLFRDLWVNGVQQATNTTNVAGGIATVANIGASYTGGAVSSGLYLDGAIPLSLVWNRPLPDAELALVTANPWQVIRNPQRRLLVDAPAAVGTNLTPGSGALTLAGFAPSVSQPQTISPGPSAVTITGYAPSVNQSTTLMPGPGTLALTGYAPAVTQPKTLTPGAGALAISGFAPSVSQNVQLSPTPGALVITGRAPTISQPRTVSPAAAALAVTGYAPGISQSYLPPANEFYTTIMRVSTVYADAGAPSTDINVSGQIDGALFLTTIMRASTVNETGNMSAAPINLTGNLL